MKKLLGTLVALAVLGAGAQKASAGNREWATAGKVLTGVAGGLLLAKALEPVPVYTVETTYVAPAPAPVVVQSAPVVTAAPTVPSAPTVVYQQPAPTVVYQQPTVVYQTAPVVIAPAPVYYYPRYYAPAPVISFGFGFGGGYHHGYYGHRRW